MLPTAKMAGKAAILVGTMITCGPALVAKAVTAAAVPVPALARAAATVVPVVPVQQLHFLIGSNQEAKVVAMAIAVAPLAPWVMSMYIRVQVSR